MADNVVKGEDTPSRLCLPGFGLPLDQSSHLPTAVDGWSQQPLSVRERVMIQTMSSLKDKPDWERKVFDETIVAKWKNEALQMGQRLLALPNDEGDFIEPSADPYVFYGKPMQKAMSEQTFNYLIEELRASAESSRRLGMTSTLSANASVYISDTAINADLQQALRTAVAPLENVSEKLKDWHPGSDEKVLDLVHPSLFPLIYGRSRILPHGTVPIGDCGRFIGQGEIVPVPDVDGIDHSATFQWLPCEVKFGEDGAAKITSYINNLYPQGNRSLYRVVEKVIEKSVPLWIASILSTLYHHLPTPRIPREVVGDAYLERFDDHQEEEDWDVNRDDNILVPEPSPRPAPPDLEEEMAHLRQELADTGLQVIVKLANIHLTPDKPSYDGGTWHIEGQLNEHICASALYYYDSENITDSFLAFREGVDKDVLSTVADQDMYGGMLNVYGIESSWDDALQVLGQVLTREGRLLAFPNVLQHRVSPFRLADESKPGHRKLLALFLVDPWIRIPSTANVPPQQADWWTREHEVSKLLGRLPAELGDFVLENVDFPIQLDEAKKLREQLIDERKNFITEVEGQFQIEDGYSFCEH